MRIPLCESGDIASHIPDDIEIDGQTISDVVGSTEVTLLCQWAQQTEVDSAPNLLRGQKLIEALGEYAIALICEDGAQSSWHYVLDGDTSPKAFAEFGIHVGLEIIYGAITASTVAATSLSGPVAVFAGAAMANSCSNAVGEVAVWIVEGMDYLVQRLKECGQVGQPHPLIPWTGLGDIGTCLVFGGGSDSTGEGQPAQSPARITETPQVCARIDGDWLDITWNSLSQQSTNRLRWWDVSWGVYKRPGYTSGLGYELLATNVRQLRVLRPGWITSGNLAEADWRVTIMPTSGVRGDAFALQDVSPGGGWTGAAGVGEC
ncbi:hypothetical protein [Candidatus Poriferisodalis sp.]|uniref:hypothetical protein n=1 Tax=Candidatus Poriferisodalis sp. TaxID=3101277 RepID=UPI003B01675B